MDVRIPISHGWFVVGAGLAAVRVAPNRIEPSGARGAGRADTGVANTIKLGGNQAWHGLR